MHLAGAESLACSLEPFRGCRAVALAKADVFDLATATQRATTTRQALVHYVYILQSNVNKKRFYTGLTDNLYERV